jgi:hypothetical protein|nr:MAG TPA: hypothetical protein [Caudoviricetes sp.]
METMMNPMEMISLLKGRNPEELVMSMIKNNNINDPTINELIGYAKNGDNENLTKLAESIFQKQGKDFMTEYNNFMAMLK